MQHSIIPFDYTILTLLQNHFSLTDIYFCKVTEAFLTD